MTLRNLSADQRATLNEAKGIMRTVRREAKAARPPQVRPTAPGQRKPRLRDNGHLQFIRRLPCIVCVLDSVKMRGVDACHVRTGYPEAGWSYTGKAEKPDDWRTWPGCRAHHDQQHAWGNEAKWWEGIGLYPPSVCAALVAGREACLEPLEAVRRAIAAGQLSRPLPRDDDALEQQHGR